MPSDTRIRLVDSMVDLRSLTWKDGAAVILAGHAAPGDGGGGIFVWDADITTADDGGTLIVPTATPRQGCWKRVFDRSEYSVKWFGARGDNIADDTVAIQNTIEAARRAASNPNTAASVLFPPGTYRVSDEIKGYGHLTLRGPTAAGVNGVAAATLITTTAFAANTTGSRAVIRAASRNVDNYGFSVENLAIRIATTRPNVIGVDFSSVWYGVLRGVAVLGNMTASPRQPMSVGSVGFFFSDADGLDADGAPIAAGRACFSNLVERTSAAGVTTGYRFLSAYGNTTLQTVTSFWVSDCHTGVWTHSIGNVGLTFRDGYLEAQGVQLSGRKSFKHTGGYPFVTLMNIQEEFFDAGSDLAYGNTFCSVGYRGEPPAAGTFEGVVTAYSLRRIVVGNEDDPGAGESEAKPLRPGVYKGARSLSFWAKLPANTELSDGENVFTYYSQITSSSEATPPPVLPDLYFTCHVSRDGGLKRPISWSGRAEMSLFPGTSTWFLTYRLSLYVNLPAGTTFQLPQDLVFYLETNQTTPASSRNRKLNGRD